jgi:hypothetical protein
MSDENERMTRAERKADRIARQKQVEQRYLKNRQRRLQRTQDFS